MSIPQCKECKEPLTEIIEVSSGVELYHRYVYDKKAKGYVLIEKETSEATDGVHIECLNGHFQDEPINSELITLMY